MPVEYNHGTWRACVCKAGVRVRGPGRARHCGLCQWRAAAGHDSKTPDMMGQGRCKSFSRGTVGLQRLERGWKAGLVCLVFLDAARALEREHFALKPLLLLHPLGLGLRQSAAACFGLGQLPRLPWLEEPRQLLLIYEFYGAVHLRMQPSPPKEPLSRHLLGVCLARCAAAPTAPTAFLRLRPTSDTFARQ